QAREAGRSVKADRVSQAEAAKQAARGRTEAARAELGRLEGERVKMVADKDAAAKQAEQARAALSGAETARQRAESERAKADQALAGARAEMARVEQAR